MNRLPITSTRPMCAPFVTLQCKAPLLDRILELDGLRAFAILPVLFYITPGRKVTGPASFRRPDGWGLIYFSS